MASYRAKWTVPAVLALGCVLRFPVAGSAAQMVARLDRDTIYLGTQTLLLVDVADPPSTEWPVVAPVAGLSISRYGVPGSAREWPSGSTRLNFRFLVNPSRVGEFRIPSVTLGSGPTALTQGPFTLRVLEATLKPLSIETQPTAVRVGEKATITVAYQGVRPGKGLVLPDIKGLTLRQVVGPRIEMTRSEGLPISIYQVEVTATQLGTYEIKGLTLDGVPAGPVTLRVSPFVIAKTQVDEPSLVAGGQTLVHLVVRGLPPSAGVKLMAPPGLKIQSVPSPYQGTPEAGVFSFQVTADEPGTPTITTLQLADGSQASLAKPIALSVRSSGEPGILASRGAARAAETLVGEPFIVDYEVFFRGDLQVAAIDLGKTEFADRPYVKVEPAGDLSYPNWSGQPTEVQFDGKSKTTALSGNGLLDGRKEQLLRLALKITPLAAGELQLKGVRIAMRLKYEQRGPGTVFRGIRDYACSIDLPPHRVMDPPGRHQPPGYRGAVGVSFTYTATLDRTTATAMSPLTLTLKIAGEGVGPQFKPPPLAEIPELVRDFDVAPTVGGGEVQGNAITFTQVIRPRAETVKELPALPLVYYNYVKKDYETVYSLPIAIAVTPGGLVGATDMQTRSEPRVPAAAGDAKPGDARPGDARPGTARLGDTQPGGGDQLAGTAQPGAAHPGAARSGVTHSGMAHSGVAHLFRGGGRSEIAPLGANHTTLGELEARAPFGPVGVVAVLLAGPCGILAVWASRRWRERRRPLAAIRRQRRELAESLERITATDDFYVRLADLVQSYLRLTFGLPPGELSAAELARELNAGAVKGDLRQAIEELLARCDTGRFAAAQVDETEKTRLVEQARRIFVGLDRTLGLDRT